MKDCTDITTKNNLDLVKWALEAQKSSWGYVFGTYGTVLNESAITSKAAQYPDEVGGNEEFIRQNWLGRRTSDCVGLMKGYGWLNAETQEIVYCTNGMPDIGADTMYNAATEKGAIDTIPEIPGLAVWHEGHIGVYIGNDGLYENMLDELELIIGRDIEDMSDTEIDRGVIQYIDEHYERLSEADSDAISNRNADLLGRLICYLGENESGEEFYLTLSQKIGMTDDEIRKARFYISRTVLR